jgi:hypothetical protein
MLIFLSDARSVSLSYSIPHCGVKVRSIFLSYFRSRFVDTESIQSSSDPSPSFRLLLFVTRTVVARDYSLARTEFGLVPRFLLTTIFAATGILFRRGLPHPRCRRQKPSCAHSSSSPDPVLLSLFCCWLSLFT